jgi:hypothetical protein
MSVTVRRGDPGYWPMGIVKHRPAGVCVFFFGGGGGGGRGGCGEGRCFLLSSSTLW